MLSPNIYINKNKFLSYSKMYPWSTIFKCITESQGNIIYIKQDFKTHVENATSLLNVEKKKLALQMW